MNKEDGKCLYIVGQYWVAITRFLGPGGLKVFSAPLKLKLKPSGIHTWFIFICMYDVYRWGELSEFRFAKFRRITYLIYIHSSHSLFLAMYIHFYIYTFFYFTGFCFSFAVLFSSENSMSNFCPVPQNNYVSGIRSLPWMYVIICGIYIILIMKEKKKK